MSPTSLRPLIAVLILAAAPALAQTTENTAPEADPEPGSDWSASVNATFFNDATRSTLRTPDEIAAGWASLEEADKEQVRSVCASHGMSASPDNAADSAGSSDGTGEPPATDEGPISAENLSRICATVTGP